jgi:hypothetical protein
MLPAGFEPAIPTSEKLQNNTIDGVATGIGSNPIIGTLNYELLICDAV